MLTNPTPPSKHKVNDLNWKNTLNPKGTKIKAPQLKSSTEVYQKMVHHLPTTSSRAKPTHYQIIMILVSHMHYDKW